MSEAQVWKFGGSSVDSAEKRFLVGQKIAAERRSQLAVVVSACAGETDRLIREISGEPSVPPDVIDGYVATGEMQSAGRMAAAINRAGRRAEVVPATLIFACDGRFGDATVLHVDPAPLLARWLDGIVPVLGGFFGQSPDGRICLLGRGGSDYSALLIAARLRCDAILFKAECDGIYDADPNHHPNARRYDRLTHEQALELASSGAKVLSAKAARVAMQYRVTIVVRPTFQEGPGTVIGVGTQATALDDDEVPSNGPPQ